VKSAYVRDLHTYPFCRILTSSTIDRIAGATTEINALKDAYNRGEFPLRPFTDIHAICDLVKSWFRVLPEPVFPPDSYRDVMEAMRESFKRLAIPKSLSLPI